METTLKSILKRTELLNRHVVHLKRMEYCMSAVLPSKPKWGWRGSTGGVVCGGHRGAFLFSAPLRSYGGGDGGRDFLNVELWAEEGGLAGTS